MRLDAQLVGRDLEVGHGAVLIGSFKGILKSRHLQRKKILDLYFVGCTIRFNSLNRSFSDMMERTF